MLEKRLIRSLERKEQVCYCCNKRGHKKYECKEAATRCETCMRDGHIRDMQLGKPIACGPFRGRQETDEQILLNPHLLQLVMSVTPTQGKSKATELFKAALHQLDINLHYTQYSIGPIQSSNPLRKNDLIVTFADKRALSIFQEKCRTGLFAYIYLNNTLQLQVKDETFEVQFRDHLSPEMERIYAKLKSLGRKFNLVIQTNFKGDAFYVSKGKFHFHHIEDDEDVNHLKSVLESIEKNKTIRERLKGSR